MSRKTSSRAVKGNGDAADGYNPYKVKYSALNKLAAVTELVSEVADIGVRSADLAYNVQVEGGKFQRDEKIRGVAKRRGVSEDVVRDAVELYEDSRIDRVRRGAGQISDDTPILNNVELGYFGLRNEDLGDLKGIAGDLNAARARNSKREAFYRSPQYWGVRTALNLPMQLRGVWDSPSAHPTRKTYSRVPIRDGKVFEL